MVQAGSAELLAIIFNFLSILLTHILVTSFLVMKYV